MAIDLALQDPLPHPENIVGMADPRDGPPGRGHFAVPDRLRTCQQPPGPVLRNGRVVMSKGESR
jgi:hypothetical protein